MLNLFMNEFKFLLLEYLLTLLKISIFRAIKAIEATINNIMFTI